MISVKEIIYPSNIKCIVCDEELPVDTRSCVCENCKLPYIDNYCTVCGREIAAQNIICDSCKNTVVPFIEARSSFVYKDGAMTLVRRLKYRDAKYLASYMAEFMADTYYSADWKVDIVTSVPVHKSTKRVRGYNQSQLLASELSKRIGVESAVLLKKTVKTKDLVGQTRLRRAEIVKGAFTIADGVDVKGKSVLLVDDVFTTGATASECSKMLMTAGAGGVYVLTFASGAQNSN